MGQVDCPNIGSKLGITAMKGDRCQRLKALAAICSGLSDSTEDDDYHLDEHFWGSEPGAIATVVYRHDKL